jgi:site-specific DNA-methyltransferase (adenine-specific)
MIQLNTLHNEDCLDTMSKIDDSTIDLTLTSPPYDDLRTYNAHLSGNKTEYNGYSFPFENIARELFRITKKGGVVVWVVGDATNKGSETGTSFKQALFFKECGFNLYDTMIYQKTGTPFPQKTRYNQTFEYMFVFSKGKPNTFNPIMKKNVTAGAVRNSRKFRNVDGEMIPGFNGKPVNEYGIENNIWLIKNGMNKSTKDLLAFEHPAIFPEELAAKHIITWTKKEDIVYDPFMGSGTTLSVANRMKRNSIGIEIMPEYYEMVKKQLESVEFYLLEPKVKYEKTKPKRRIAIR